MGKQTFILEISDTRYQSWQGTLKWLSGHKQESFRSMLEMLHLLDSVINEEDGEGPPDPGQDWLQHSRAEQAHRERPEKDCPAV